MEKISPKICKDIEKSRFRSRSRDFCQFLEGFGNGLGKFGLGKKSQFRKTWYQKKSLGISFGQNFGTVIQCTGGGGLEAAKNNFKTRQNWLQTYRPTRPKGENMLIITKNQKR